MPNSKSTFWIELYPDMDDDTIEYMINTIINFVHN